LEFDRCDVNHDGELDLSELEPVVESVLGFSSWAITTEHIRRFSDIFDADSNGVITSDEFLSFSQFLVLMTYLQDAAEVDVDTGMPVGTGDEVGEALEVDDDRGVRRPSGGGAIDAFMADRSFIEANLSRFPVEVMMALTNEEFQNECEAKFDALDVDGDGVLTPDELYPVVEGLLKSQVSAQQWTPISQGDCEKLARALDTDGDGVISNFEFQQFCQVLCDREAAYQPIN
jgi:Ca2+-binding EF-hand superfamily protein